MVKLIVLDQRIGSMTEFKQIVGRGTRIREKEGKTHFTIMDFRNVTRLFADPDWDGPIEVNDNYVKGTPKPYPEIEEEPMGVSEPEPERPPKPIVDKDGCTVEVINKVVIGIRCQRQVAPHGKHNRLHTKEHQRHLRQS